MKISGRNFIPGKVLEIKEGATTAHVRVEVAGGAILTASITNEAVEELGLKTGDKVHALIKASDVMIAVGN
jgi:molybdopterin-binding protein